MDHHDVRGTESKDWVLFVLANIGLGLSMFFALLAVVQTQRAAKYKGWIENAAKAPGWRPIRREFLALNQVQLFRLLAAWNAWRSERPLYRNLLAMERELKVSVGFTPPPIYTALCSELEETFSGPERHQYLSSRVLIALLCATCKRARMNVDRQAIQRAVLHVLDTHGTDLGDPFAAESIVDQANDPEMSFDELKKLIDFKLDEPTRDNLRFVANQIRLALLAERARLVDLQYELVTRQAARLTVVNISDSDHGEGGFRKVVEELRRPLRLLRETERELLRDARASS